MQQRPVRSWLYAPGNSARLLERVFTAGADAVILDLEDAVPAAEKRTARTMVAKTIDKHVADGGGGPALWVRVNHPATGLTEADIAAVVRHGLVGVRLPKVESALEVERVEAWLTAAERQAGLTEGRLGLVCSIESALGVHHAAEIASAGQRIVALTFGGVDFNRDVNAAEDADGLATLYARSALVVASRVGGIGPPIDGVFREIRDDDGLERSTRQSKGLGFFGRSAIHPRQLPIIHAVYTPTADEVAWATRLLAAAADAERAGSGALQLDTGEFVDVPVVRRAEAVLRLAEHLQP